MVTIRTCQASDVADLMAFLDSHWKRGHIFTVNRDLFDWQHALRDRPGQYTFALARRDADQALLGVLGYTTTRQFDPALADDNTVWLALWKVREDADSAGLGLQLLKYVIDSEPHTTIGVIGFNTDVLRLYQALGFTVGELRHYVIANPDVDRFEVATLRRPAELPIGDEGLTAVTLTPENFSAQTAGLDLGTRLTRVPRKTPEFFCTRYLHHPLYRYRCDAIGREGRIIGLLTTRIAKHAGHRVIRVVDYLGPDDAIPGLGSLILSQVTAAGAEYADVYNAGIDPDAFRRAGFSPVDPDGSDIVPDHFEPFEARNIRLRFAIQSQRPAVLFKGDGDQDRPSRMPG